MSLQDLRAYARSIRNLALMFGFLFGLVGLLSLPVGLSMLVTMPDLIRPYMDRYPDLYRWLLIGLASGLLAAYRYRTAYPHNPRGAMTLSVVTIGLCVIIGAGFAFLGTWGGIVAVLFGALGVGSYIYVERTNDPQ